MNCNEITIIKSKQKTNNFEYSLIYNKEDKNYYIKYLNKNKYKYILCSEEDSDDVVDNYINNSDLLPKEIENILDFYQENKNLIF